MLPIQSSKSQSSSRLVGDLDLETRLLEPLGPLGDRQRADMRRVAAHLDLVQHVARGGGRRAVDERRRRAPA